MAQQALSSEADTSSRGPLSRIIRQDKMPLLVLLLAALVGTLAGLVCGLFESGVHWLAEQRIALLADRPLVAARSARLWLQRLAGICRLLPHSYLCPGSGWFRHSRDRGGDGRSAPGSVVAGVAGQVLRRHLHPEFRHGAGGGRGLRYRSAATSARWWRISSGCPRSMVMPCWPPVRRAVWRQPSMRRWRASCS